MQARNHFLGLLGAALLVGGLATENALADTKLRAFAGGSGQRPDLMRKLFDQYQAKNPDSSRADTSAKHWTKASTVAAVPSQRSK